MASPVSRLLLWWSLFCVLNLFIYSIVVIIIYSDSHFVYIIFIFIFNFVAALHTTWDLSSSSPTQGWSLHPLTLEAWHLSSWTAREVPSVLFRDHLLSPCALPSLSLGTRFFFLVSAYVRVQTHTVRQMHTQTPPPHPELKSLQVKHWCVLEDFSNGLAEGHMNNLKWTAGAPWLLCRVWNSGCGPGHAAPSFSLPSSSSSFCPSPLGNKTSSHSRIGRSF